LRAVPTTEDRGQALKWVGALAGVEGPVGKRINAPYAAGLASGWVKWRERHTAEAVVIG
jgi:bifunctional non-homologous end joining protein LigD